MNCMNLDKLGVGVWNQTEMGGVRCRWYWWQNVISENKTMALKDRIGSINPDEVAKLFQSRNFPCFIREWVKREEKIILQHQTTFHWKQHICQLEIIPYAPMDHPNIPTWSYTPRNITLNNTTMSPHLISQHLRPHPPHTQLYRHHHAAFHLHLYFYQSLHFSLQPILSGFLSNLYSHHSQHQPWQYRPPRIEVLREHYIKIQDSVHIVYQILPQLAGHPWTLQVPKSKNHTLSTVWGSLTGYS